MREFTVVLVVSDQYDRYTSSELITEIKSYIISLDLKVESSTIQIEEYQTSKPSEKI